MATSAWFPVVTLLIGWVSSSATTWLQNHLTNKREREARNDERKEARAERRESFQRETLLSLQDAVMALMRCAGQTDHLDQLSLKRTGKWHSERIPDDLDEDFRARSANVSLLTVRVQDPKLRELVNTLRSHVSMIGIADSRAIQSHSFSEAASAFEQVNVRVGEILRQLDS